MSTDRGLSSRRSRREPSALEDRTSPRTRLVLLLAAVVSVIALVVGISLLLQRPVLPLAPTGGETTAPTSTTEPEASAPSPEPVAAVPSEVGRRDASIGSGASTSVDAPTEVRVPSVGLELTVVPVGVREDGQMDVPEFVGELGWYRFGPAPGADAGSAVLAAHVDSELGRAPMAEVLYAESGDAVEVTTASGSALGYRIISIEQISKDEMPLDAMFARDGEHVLRLITCGGEWDAAAGAYEDNIVVTAVLDAP